MEKVLIFLHIPKAAGTTMHRVLEREYGLSSCFTMDSRELDPIVSGIEKYREIRDSGPRVIKGHFPFGLHRYLPESSTYVTVLRNPVERVLSTYYYILRTPHHPKYDLVAGRNLTLHDFLESGLVPMANNGMTRLLCGIDDVGRKVAYGECSLSMLETARKNLETYFSAVGLSERFDETLLLFSAVLGWRKRPFYTRENVSGSRPSGSNVAADTMNLIMRLNRLDMDLYDGVAEEFNRGLAEMNIGRAKVLRLRLGGWLHRTSTA